MLLVKNTQQRRKKSKNVVGENTQQRRRKKTKWFKSVGKKIKSENVVGENTQQWRKKSKSVVGENTQQRREKCCCRKTRNHSRIKNYSSTAISSAPSFRSAASIFFACAGRGFFIPLA